MPTVDLLDEDEYAEEIQQLDEQLRQYTQVPSMTPYVKAAGHYTPVLEHLLRETLYVMPSDDLSRRVKEMVGLAVSMVNGCSYCIRAHTAVLRNMFDADNADIVELAGAVAHVSALNGFETATMGDPDDPLFKPRSPDEVQLLAEIESELGLLPEYYRIMARDEAYLERIWGREQSMLFKGEIDRSEKELIALAVSMANGAQHSIRVHKQILSDMGTTDAELFEALRVVENYQKHNRFTTGLELDPDVELGTQ